MLQSSTALDGPPSRRPGPRGGAFAHAALALLLAAPAARAQSEPPRLWSEAAVLDRANARSPDVQAARFALETARASGAFGRVPRIGNPVVGVRAMLGVPNAGEVSSYNVTLGVPIDVSGQRPLFGREARWAVREAEARLDAAVNDARGAALAGYVELAATDTVIRVTAERAEGAREVLARARAAVERGAATELAVALAERELAEASADVEAARRARDEAAGRFREALDLTSADPARVAPLGAPAPVPGLTRAAAVRLAVARRREVAAGHAAAQRLHVSADRLRAQAVGPLWVTPETALANTQTAQTTAGVSLQWAIPLLQTAQGERAVARAQGTAFRAEALRAARRADREAGTAWDVLEGRLRELAALEREAIPALERTLRATERRVDSGEADLFRALYARRELALMRVRAASVAREAWRTRVALERAVGRAGGGAR